jgi:sec-independent protein translocase protein TatC
MAKHRIHRLEDKESEEAQSRMSFGEHLEELRKRIMYSLYGGVFGVGICVYFVKEIYAFVVAPYRDVALRNHVSDVMYVTNPSGAFFTPLSLAIKAGLILVSPWIIYQLWQFVGAGLYKRERKIIYRYIGPSALLFLLGVAFFYFIVLPLTLEFFFVFSGSGGGMAQPNSFFRWLAQATGQVQLPPPVKARGPTSTTLSTAALNIPWLDHDPAPPPEGQALLFFHTREQRVKIMLHDQTQILTVVAQDALFTNTWKADEYLSFVSLSALIFGLAFQLPMVILVLAQIDIVQTQTFRNIRKYAYFGLLIAAVIIAPSGDVMTLAFLFIPMILLYEIGILMAAIATRGKPQED